MPALLCSVGGSPDPIIHVIRARRPTHVAYFCSSGSRAKAEEIQAQLTFAPASDYLEVEKYEELGPCYAALRDWLPRWLSDRQLKSTDVTVDYTGGTKTMSAALVLAATELFSHFSYVGGTQRDKAGTGVVISGAERLHYQANPWRELAVRELDHASKLWSLQQYDAAAELLRRAKPQVPLEQRRAFERVINLARALSDRLALQLPRASKTLADLAKKLRQRDPISKSSAKLLSFCERATFRLAAAHGLNGPAEDPNLQLRELLDNALLTARLGRYDDAAARLYRALELFGQNELTRLTQGAFLLGRLQGVSLPSALVTFGPFQGIDGVAAAQSGVALEGVFRALAHLGHDAGMRASAEIDGPNSLHSPWRQATTRRNQSILAHGLQPVDELGFRTLAALVSSYTGQKLNEVDLEAPEFDFDWFA